VFYLMDYKYKLARYLLLDLILIHLPCILIVLQEIKLNALKARSADEVDPTEAPAVHALQVVRGKLLSKVITFIMVFLRY